MKKQLLSILALVLALLLVSNFALAEETTTKDFQKVIEDSKGQVNLFYSYTCPHCHKEMAWLDELKLQNPDLVINLYETTREENSYNRALFQAYADYYQSSNSGVPRTFIKDKAFIGFDPGEGELQYNPAYKANIGYKNQLLKAINELDNVTLNNTGKEKTPGEEVKSAINPLLIFFLVIIYIPTYFIFKKKLSKSEQARRYWIAGLAAVFIICFFIFLLIVPEAAISGFAQKLPFPLFVLIISLADGFNPCSFAVLFILLSLLTYAKNKQDMRTVGVIFIVVSSIMYFIFIMVMILVGSVFIESYGELILKILGVIVLIAGGFNLKDYLFFKKGASLSMSDKDKKKFTTKARKIVQSLNKRERKKGLVLALGGTALLAIGVSIVELGCTAILPAVYMSSLLTKLGLTVGLGHILWTAAYAIIYIIPLTAILINFLFVFKSERVNEGQGRILKLAGGIFMFVCGLIMILNPQLLMFG